MIKQYWPGVFEIAVMCDLTLRVRYLVCIDVFFLCVCGQLPHFCWESLLLGDSSLNRFRKTTWVFTFTLNIVYASYHF